jgi:hypothetical protein
MRPLNLVLAVAAAMTLSSDAFGYAIDVWSPGGNIDQFIMQREQMIENGVAPRLHKCASACTMFLSVPGACVYPNSRIGFHQAYQIAPGGVVPSPDGTAQMWSTYPALVRRVAGWPMHAPPGMKIVSGATLIADGFPRCR